MNINQKNQYLSFPHFLFYPLDADADHILRDKSDCKIIHLIRHGEATHQVTAIEEAKKGRKCRCFDSAWTRNNDVKDCPFLDPLLIDSELTRKGREEVMGQAAGCGAELIFTAAARRSIQTAIDSFTVKGSAGMGKPGIPKIIVLEHLRSLISAHIHSKRLPLDRLKAAFPEADFSFLEHNEDVFWKPETESRLSLDFRLSLFLRELFRRPEKNIAVVTHFTVLLALFSAADETEVLGKNLLRPAHDLPWLYSGEKPVSSALNSMLKPGEISSLIIVPD